MIIIHTCLLRIQSLYPIFNLAPARPVQNSAFWNEISGFRAGRTNAFIKHAFHNVISTNPPKVGKNEDAKNIEFFGATNKWHCKLNVAPATGKRILLQQRKTLQNILDYQQCKNPRNEPKRDVLPDGMSIRLHGK